MEGYLRSVRGEFEEKLAALVEIPSVSADPNHAEDIKRCAKTAALWLKAIGADSQVIQTAGHPVVIGRLQSHPSNPTVLIYNHLDVQPADASEWQHPPFSFSKVGDRYGGRGTTDDKGPALTALFAARFAKERKFPLNIQWIWELEEEIGSPNFEQFMRSHPHLTADSVVVSDTIWIARRHPTVPYGLRGLQTLVLTLQTHEKDVHSGLTGGVARNPIGELCELVSACYDAQTGHVKIPGFYDEVSPLTREEIEQFLRSGFQTSRYKKAHGLTKIRPHLTTEADVLSAIMAAPTFEVHGFVGGYSGPGIKTIVPHHAEVKISMRLVPNQKPNRIVKQVKAYLKRLNPDVRVEATQTLQPFLGPRRGFYADAARVAMKAGFGKDPVFVREGGSIGAVVTLQKQLRVPIIFLGLSLPEHGYHAKNENFDWGQAAGGMKMFVRYFEVLAKQGKR